LSEIDMYPTIKSETHSVKKNNMKLIHNVE